MTASLAQTVSLALACALLLWGAVAAWSASNVAKRLAGILVAHVAALLAMAVLGAGEAAIAVGVAVCLAYCIVGVSLLVRLQEAYASAEAKDVDAADAAEEPREPEA